MARPSHLVLVDGALCADPQAQRADAVAHMAAELLRFEAYADEYDARLTLRMLNYRPFEIEALIDDARMVAMQHVVAKEMCAS